MSLIDVYVSEVGRHLPRRQRADIEAEIRSALQDLLDERARTTGAPVDDEAVLEVLSAHGDPEKVAASYGPERVLIGPHLYPTFVAVVWIAASIIGVLSLVALGFALAGFGRPADHPIVAVIGAADGFLRAMSFTLGVIVVVFGAIERFTPRPVRDESRWDARSLRKVSPPDRVKVVEVGVEMFFTAVAVVIFNVFPQSVSLGASFDGHAWVGLMHAGTGSKTVLSEAFFRVLPVLNAVWIVTLLVDVAVLRRRRWETWSRWAVVGLKVAMIAIAAFMLAGESLIAVTAQSLVDAGLAAPRSAQLLVDLLDRGARLALVLTILFSGLDLVKALVRLARRSARPVWRHA